MSINGKHAAIPIEAKRWRRIIFDPDKRSSRPSKELSAFFRLFSRESRKGRDSAAVLNSRIVSQSGPRSEEPASPPTSEEAILDYHCQNQGDGRNRWALAAMERLIEETAQTIHQLNLPHPIRVGIDGNSAAGKSTFARHLEKPLRKLGRTVVRATIDGFHNPSSIRYRRGELCPIGYIEDSFDKAAVIENMLHPFGPNGGRHYRSSLFDWKTNRQTEEKEERARDDSVLLFEGVLLFCDQLQDHFDMKIFLHASETKIVERALIRDSSRLGGEKSLLEKYHKRYLPGQREYEKRHRPREQAHFVISNENFKAPYFIKKRCPQQSPRGR